LPKHRGEESAAEEPDAAAAAGHGFDLGESCKRALDGFSHQLRTPLTTISGLAETLLMRKELDASTQQQFLEKIHDQAARACAVLDDLRELTRLERGADSESMKELDLLIPVAEAMQGVVQAAEMKGLSVEINTPGDPVLVRGDSGALRLLTTNLLENAIRYTRYGGSIRLNVITREGQALLTVEDTGVGIAPEEQELVFSVFYRGSRGRELARQGTGLGLAIVRQVAATHDGEVTLTSAPDEGTRITVALPLADRAAD
jgi:two-component system phosphate regulon sensor histidine kinase PhoR